MIQLDACENARICDVFCRNDSRIRAQGDPPPLSTILVIEDSPRQRAEVRAALEESGFFDSVIEANDGIEGLRLMLSASPDMVLCGLEMPGLNGEKLLRMCRRAGNSDDSVSFIVLTAVTDPARRARLLQEGASDTITKPFHTADLIARVGLHLKLAQTQRELREKNHELQRLSRTDFLTGVANRRHLEDMLSAEFARSRRNGVPFSVALGDIDLFKSVNDEHGHLVGDSVLVGVADAMRQTVRDTDCGGRFGGEEFLAILSNNDCAGARIFAERWRELVEDIKIEVKNGETASATISIGVACWNPDLDSPEPIIRWADEALYRAKASGRNRVCVYSDAEGHIEVAPSSSTS